MPPTFYLWAPKAARYRDPETGQFVPRSAIAIGVDAAIRASQNRISDASDGLRNGRIDLAEWQEVMREEIKRTQLEAEALLRGGWKQMTQADYGRVGARVKEQYAYLTRFTFDLRAGLVRTDGLFMSRARSYASAARTGFYEGQSEQLLGVGYRQELNVLHPAEHCSDCVEATNRGWVPIGTNPPIGTRKCLSNDKCDFRYR